MIDKEPTNKRQRVSHLRWVRVDDIIPSPLGQREFRPAWANEIASNFKLEALGYPVLSLREGVFYVVDGQHRLAAARIFGFGDDALQCEVYEGLTEQDEAELFIERNASKTVEAYSKFKAAVYAQRPAELSIYGVVASLGLTIAKNRGENAVGSVTALGKIRERIGVAGLSRVLRILRDAYGYRGLDGPVMSGLSLVLHRYDGQIDDSLMTARLASTTGGLNGLLQPAGKLKMTTGQNMTQCIAASVVGIYNRDQRSKK